MCRQNQLSQLAKNRKGRDAESGVGEVRCYFCARTKQVLHANVKKWSLRPSLFRRLSPAERSSFLNVASVICLWRLATVVAHPRLMLRGCPASYLEPLVRPTEMSLDLKVFSCKF